jgi:GAF domain-containing protein
MSISFDTDSLDLEASLHFSTQLQIVSNKIHAAVDLDAIMFDLSKDICALFNCDRLTLYARGKDGNTIYSKIKTGIDSNKDLVLPINAMSIAGYVALSKHSVCIKNVYDQAELRAIAPELTFFHQVDQLTGYHTAQMAAAPIVDSYSRELLGVIQLINNRAEGAFAAHVDEGLRDLCATLAVAFRQRMKAPVPKASVPSIAATNDDAEAIARQLQFARQLQIVSNQIHAAHNVDAIMLDMAAEICALFQCDRLTVYAVSEDRKTIYSKVKTGIRASKELVLPINALSIAGNVALHKRSVRVRDVYDAAELDAQARELVFCKRVDELTGYRSRQMLAAPIIDAQSKEVIGVVQLVNNRDERDFSAFDEEGLRDLCETMAIALTHCLRAPLVTGTRYDALFLEGALSVPEFELAARWASRQGREFEQVLTDEFHLAPALVGRALARHFNVPYEPYKPNRARPAELIKGKKRAYFEQQGWLPLEKERLGVLILCSDPEQVKRAGGISEFFPYETLFYRVTTKRELRQTLDDYFG